MGSLEPWLIPQPFSDFCVQRKERFKEINDNEISLEKANNKLRAKACLENSQWTCTWSVFWNPSNLPDQQLISQTRKQCYLETELLFQDHALPVRLGAQCLLLAAHSVQTLTRTRLPALASLGHLETFLILGSLWDAGNV